jgi:hypothetical protein
MGLLLCWSSSHGVQASSQPDSLLHVCSVVPLLCCATLLCPCMTVMLYFARAVLRCAVLPPCCAHDVQASSRPDSLLHLPARVDHLSGTACIAGSSRQGLGRDGGSSSGGSSMNDHSKHSAHKVRRVAASSELGSVLLHKPLVWGTGQQHTAWQQLQAASSSRNGCRVSIDSVAGSPRAAVYHLSGRTGMYTSLVVV